MTAPGTGQSRPPPVSCPPRRGRRRPVPDFAPAVLVAGVIAVAATIPVPAPTGAPSWSATAVHVGLYAALCATLLPPWRARGWPWPRGGPFTVSVAYGVLHELWQAVLPHRAAAAGDVVADAVGALLAIVVASAAAWGSD